MSRARIALVPSPTHEPGESPRAKRLGAKAHVPRVFYEPIESTPAEQNAWIEVLVSLMKKRGYLAKKEEG